MPEKGDRGETQKGCRGAHQDDERDNEAAGKGAGRPQRAPENSAAVVARGRFGCRVAGLRGAARQRRSPRAFRGKRIVTLGHNRMLFGSTQNVADAAASVDERNEVAGLFRIGDPQGFRGINFAPQIGNIGFHDGNLALPVVIPYMVEDL